MAGSFSIRPLTAAIGAEIEGIDVGTIEGAAEIDRLRDALNQHQVLFFRDQDITPAQQVRFANLFGDVSESLVDPGNAPAPGITVIEVAEPKGLADEWHSDHTFSETPPKAAMLRSVRIPSSGGDTLWASMAAAYDALSAPMRSLLDGLTATHSTDRMMPRVMVKTNAKFRMDRMAVTHPIVRVHPETGRKCLFVSSYYTSHINELPEEESRAILGFLYQHVQSPLFQVRFKWTVNTIALWDERSTLHYAVADYSEPRVMHRLMINGDRPVGTERLRATA
jgi:taurine dioxygenase